MRKLKNYIVNGKDSEIWDISLVDAPAIEENFVYFSKENIENKKIVLMEENEKYTIVGSVLRPDFNIYRYDPETDYEYLITFTKESIAQLAHDHLRYYKNSNFSTDHETYVNNIYLMESWIVENEEDKAKTVYGLDCEVGSWVIMAKVDSTEIWDRIKNGELKGFSIEGLLGFDNVYDEYFKKIKEKENINMTKEETKGFLDEIKDIIKETLSAFKSENVQMEEEVKTEVKEEETVTEEVKEEVQMEEQTEVTQEQSEDTQTEEEVQTEEVKMEEEVKEEAAPEDGEKVEQPEIETLRAEIETLKQQLNEANEKIVEMSKEPSAKPITRGETTTSFKDTMQTLKQLSQNRPM